jgi:hypothetical protein
LCKKGAFEEDPNARLVDKSRMSIERRSGARLVDRSRAGVSEEDQVHIRKRNLPHFYQFSHIYRLSGSVTNSIFGYFKVYLKKQEVYNGKDFSTRGPRYHTRCCSFAHSYNTSDSEAFGKLLVEQVFLDIF